MTSQAYILGALDALVKSGEMSPDYAAGVISVLEKTAGKSPVERYIEQYDDFIKENPGRWNPKDETLTLSGDEAKGIIDRSRDTGWFSDYNMERAKLWAGNRARKWMRWWPSVNPKRTAEMYDRELADDYNQARSRYIRDNLNRPGFRIDPDVVGAIQASHVRDAKMRVEDAKRTMSKTEREARGLTDKYPGTYLTNMGGRPNGTVRATPNAVNVRVVGQSVTMPVPVRGGGYLGGSAYGKGIPDMYGDNKDIFYRRPVR